MRALLLALALGAQAAAPRPQAPAKHARLGLPGGRAITVDVVDTPASREVGLMYRKTLPPAYGMLFVFPRELPLTFWMKNTWTPLDIVFIRADKMIDRLHARVPASRRDASDDEVARVGGRAQYVLELPAGAARRYGLREGSALEFDVSLPAR